MVFDDDSGRAVAGASIQVFDATFAEVGRGQSDLGGRFTLTVSSTSQLVLVAARGGYFSSAPAEIDFDPNGTATVVLTLRPLQAAIDVVEREGEGQTSYVLGRVIDATSGQPILSARVSVVGREVSTLTATQGRFVFRELEPGPVTIRVEHLSFEPQESFVIMRPGLAYDLSVRMQADALQIEGITVEVRSQNTVRRLEPVYERMDRGVTAHFKLRQDFQIRGNPTIGAMLQGLPSTVVTNRGGRWSVRFRGNTRLAQGSDCSPSLWVDGIRVVRSEDAAGLAEYLSLSTIDVEIMEVYPRPNTLPPEFNDPGTLCAIGIWTRRGG